MTPLCESQRALGAVVAGCEQDLRKRRLNQGRACGAAGVETGFSFAFLRPSPMFPSELRWEDRLFRLILLFTLLPLVELSLLLRIGEWLGAGPTIGLVIVTGVAGAWLARREGLRTWERVRTDVAAGRLPAEELVHALLVLIAGIVLVTPGVLTDAAGLLLLLRPARDIVARGMRKRLAGQVQFGSVDFGDLSSEATGRPGPGSSHGPGPDRPGGRVIEIEAD